MKIGIVEDEVIWRDKIKRIIVEYIEAKSIDYEIVILNNQAEVFATDALDLLFLDIELSDGENGFEIAEKMMQEDSQCKICFLTSHTELARQGYKVNAFRYIDKRYLEEIEEAIDCFLETRIQDRTICCKTVEGIKISLNMKDILFVETSGRKLKYHMSDDNEYLSDGSLAEQSKYLSPYGFYQIQRSYIVNMKYIKTENSREVTLSNGVKITIGRGHREDFKKTFFEWRMKCGS